MITDKQRDEALKTLDNARKSVFLHPENGEVMRSIFRKNNIPSLDYLKYINTIGDTILGFYKTSELQELLQKEVGIGADDALRTAADLQEFLAPVIAREKGEINPNHEELKELQDTFTPAPTKIQPEVSTEPSTTTVAEASTTVPQEPIDQTVAPVQAMRTMEGDMSRVHGYGAYRAQFPDEAQETEHTEEVIRSASQEDILKEKPVLTSMPTYKEDEGEK